MNRARILWKMQYRFASNHLHYKDIPSPKTWPLIGHAYLFGPKGPYKFEQFPEAATELSKIYGPVFRLKLGPSFHLVVTVDADDARTIFQSEGKWPFRPPFPVLAHYRQKTFGSAGIVPGNGVEWYHFRPAVTPLLRPQLVHSYWVRQQDIAGAFVDYINKIRNPENNIVTDLYQQLSRYTIEAISVVSPGERFHCFDETERAKLIINASNQFMEGLHETQSASPIIWKFIQTAAYKKLANAHETIYSILRDSVDKAKELINDEEWKEEQPFMAEILTNNNLSWSDKLMIIMETFLGGIDATAATLTFCLHLLSLDHDRQTKARIEAEIIKKDVPAKQPRLPFLRACLKETLRMFPAAASTTRKIAQEAIIGGYLIPAGTMVTAVSPVTSRMDKYFPNADQFLPERWLRKNDGGPETSSHHPFASLPFGHGPRMCPGRRLAEQEMLLLLVEMLKHFEIHDVDTKPLGMVSRMNRIPDRIVNLKFNPIM